MRRRDFMGAVAGGVGAARAMVGTVSGQATPNRWRDAFPALHLQVNGRPLNYLDSAATTLRPQPVIDAVARFYGGVNANPGATLHTLARASAAALEESRATVSSFIGARDPLECVFTRGTTEGLNLVASTWGAANVRAGDEILLGIAEHASNMLPWTWLARRTGARVVSFGVDDEGHPRLDEMAGKVTSRTRIVAFSHVSNVLGIVNPVQEMSAIARGPNRIVVVDAAQSVPHLPVDVTALGCDFLAFSSHKMLGPMGIGVLWGRRELLESMPPYQLGSNMAHDAEVDAEHLSPGALRYGAGTPNVAGPVGLAAAIGFLRDAGMGAVLAHERAISERVLAHLGGRPRIRLLGSASAEQRVGVFSFTVEGASPSAVVSAMDAEGIAVRAGDLAALPLLRRFGVTAAARASCYLYTTTADVDRLVDVLDRLGR